MFKVLKVYLKNSRDLRNQEIYCIRLEINEGLDVLKGKVFMRSPLLKGQNPQIYWFDLENDKIVIACDDDLKFFMEESACHKLIFDFHSNEIDSSRKRNSSQIIDDSSEYSKKIRKQLENIDLSSDSSSMDTEDDDEIASSKNSSVSETEQIQEDLPSTTEPVSSSSNVKIISVDIIKPADETIDITDENGNDVDDVQVIENENGREASKEEENVQKSSSQKKQTETNRILISDSSDDEDQNDTTNNNRRRFSDEPSASASAYSFAGVGDIFDSRHSFDRNRHYRQRRPRHHYRHNQTFHEATRDFQRVHSENMQRIHQHARLARENAARAVRAGASALPDLLTTFQAHFQRPMFRVADINQQIFGNFGRR